MDNSELELLDNVQTAWNEIKIPIKDSNNHKKKHTPKIIDEDTENFKNKLGKKNIKII